jgi:hypothetical protein
MAGSERPRWLRLSIGVLTCAVFVLVPAAQEPVPPAQPSASASVAAAQGRLIVALTDLLQRGESAPMAVKTRSPLASKYTGPDAALLQLQADAIALGLEAFGTAATQPPRAANPARSR